MNLLKVASAAVLILLSACSTTHKSENTMTKDSHQIALLLPMTGSVQNKARPVNDGFFAAYTQSSSKNEIKVIDTAKNNDVVKMYNESQKSGAEFVVGPLEKNQVSRVAKEGRVRVTTLALNYTEGKLPEKFYEFGLSPNDEVNQIVARAWREGHRKVLIVVSDDHWGKNIATLFSARWIALGGSVVTTVKLNNATNFMDQLQTLVPDKNDVKSPPFDVVLLAALPDQARSTASLLRFYGLIQVPIYATSSVYSGTPSRADKDLDGVRLCDIPWVVAPTAEMMGATQQLRALHPDADYDIRLYALGIDAYRVIPELPRLASSSSARYKGLTGTLSIENQRIKRELAWGQFVNGEIIPLA